MPTTPDTHLTIILHPNGNVDVNGPLQDKILCYGLLEIAKDLIRNYKPGAILKPSPGELSLDLKKS